DKPELAVSSGQSDIVSRGEYYAAIRYAVYPPPGGSLPSLARVEIVVAHWGGSLVFHDAFDTPYKLGNPLPRNVAVRGNNAGVCASPSGWGDRGAPGVVATAGGTPAVRSGSFPGVVLKGEPDEDSVVPVAPTTTSSSAAVSWLDPCAHTVAPAHDAAAVLG